LSNLNSILSCLNSLKIQKLKDEIKYLNVLPLLNMYRNIRQELSENSTALEVKTTVKGLIQ
jgi:hypothetical protein